MVERVRDLDVPVIGALLLATDLTTERDIRALVPARVRFCVTRVAFSNPTTPNNLERTLPHLGPAAALLVPGVRLSSLYFSCTSASIMLGAARLGKAIGSGQPEAEIVTPISATVQGLRTLGARRIAIMTPYVAETAALIVRHLTDSGFDIVGTHGMDMADDRDMAVLPPEPILEAARAAVTSDAEALFISCTALPAAELVPILEAELGIPVITSNLAGLWMAMRVAGVDDAMPEHGRLMALPLAMEAA